MIPERIGIITAPTGAAIKDILSTLKRRWPLAETILFPSLVQGKEAASDIVRNIELSKKYDLDVLIIGRGGGSIEDLWCFNEEIVARAIYDLNTPVISAVGHEIDFTICDFVADLRAPTPTGAAELAVPNINDIINFLTQLKIRTINSINNILDFKKKSLLNLKNNYILKNPLTIYQIKEEKFDNLLNRLINTQKNLLNINNNKLDFLKNNLNKAILNILNEKKHKYVNIISKLEVLNPLLTIKRGYSIVKKENKVISSKKNIKKKDHLDIELSDGSIKVEVI